MIVRYSYRDRKIAFKDITDLVRQVNNLKASEIISIKPCVPDRTDTKNWVSVYYEYVYD